ncbi:hypothetical protein [Motiliproteus sp. SC1-56]|uniref:hypothetical protein n=1 Tax=Motiliproteus sp. SC1-56 TaxID=2799565 RepID=UPI001A8F7ECE|nr:hypothetical protein [Motiliproteus sp. SC1-56]
MAEKWLKPTLALLLAAGMGMPSEMVWAQGLVRLAPFNYRLTGETEFTIETAGSDGDEQTSTRLTNELETLARTRGYLWKPWFSRLDLNGDATVAQSSSSSSGGGGSEAASLSFGAGGTLALFPTSWFPTTLSLNHGRSFVDSGGRGRGRTTDTALLITQTYNSRRGLLPDLYASYNFVTSETDGAEERSQLFTLIADKEVAGHRLEGQFTWNNTEGGQLEEDTSYVLTGDHDYASSHRASYSDFVSYVRLENTLGDTNIRQYSNNYSFWLPGDVALTLSGRISDTDQQYRGESEESSTLAINASVSKRFSPYWYGAASTNYDSIEQGSGRKETYDLGLLGRYTSPILSWRGWDGVLQGDVDLQAQDQKDVSGVGYGVSLGHGWNRELGDWAGSGASVTLSFDQDVSSRFKSVEGAATDGRVFLTQSFTYSRTDAAGGRLVGQVSDSRAFNGAGRERQRLQVVFDRDFLEGGRDSLSGGWTAFVVRSSGQGDNEDDVSGGAAGVLRFTRLNLFYVPRLRYTASLTMNLTRQFSGGDARSSERNSYRIDQGVFWLFGRLSVEGEMFYRMEGEPGEEGRDQYGVSLTVTRRWDSL